MGGSLLSSGGVAAGGRGAEEGLHQPPQEAPRWEIKLSRSPRNNLMSIR